jgi:hypothetical protein
MRFMTLVRSPEPSPLGPPPMALMIAIGELGKEAAAKGVLVAQGGLMPTTAGALVVLDDDGISVLDGPFAEAKEVIGGYAVYDVPSKAEAIAWSRRFLEVHQQSWPGFNGVVELRQIMEIPG